MAAWPSRMAMSLSGPNVMAGPVRTRFDGEHNFRRVADRFGVGIQNGDRDLGIVQCISAVNDGSVRRQKQACRRSGSGPLRRRDMEVFIAIPIPLALGQPEIVHHPHGTEMTGDAAVVEGAPESLAAAPRELFCLQITPSRLIPARPVGNSGAILAHHAGNSRIKEQARPVAVIPRHIPQLHYPCSKR